MYTKPVSDIIQQHGRSHHSYTDDTQLYMTMQRCRKLSLVGGGLKVEAND